MNAISRYLAVVGCGLVAVATTISPSAMSTLTQQEINDGWIMLSDGESFFGWKSRGQAQWIIEDGVIANRPNTGPGFIGTTTEFSSYRLKLEFWIDDTANSGVFLRCPAEGEVTPLNSYEVNICDAHEKWPTGSIIELARPKMTPNTAGRWNSCDITVDGDSLVVSLNGQEVVNTRDAKHNRGVICLQQYDGKGAVKFRNIKLKPLGLKSIFNGKDLTGWREIPDRKSVFSVTSEGYMNVKDGNGDLQSEGQYGDFVFQLEIISNGTHLNSGVFFRAMTGQFWSGYESQIRNQWEGDNREKPVDYGTGGIYNHQPARRVIPSDREWFSKTIVAHGRHMAVWINGFQVSDFFDTRPPNENARRGYRAEPGALSLQGHDPTTDLSFRNLRIVELPPAQR